MRQFNTMFTKIFTMQLTFILLQTLSFAQQDWKPNTDWGHWILGQRADLEFLQKNNQNGLQKPQ